MSHPPLTVFAHGAGAPSTSAWMEGWRSRLSELGPVVTFDYAYMEAGRRRPDAMSRLLQRHRQTLEAARSAHPGPVVLAGKSMGSRVGCHLALSEPVAALVCFGYPLVGASGKVRDEVLLSLRTPILFLQGTRDRLCPLERLQEVRGRMEAPSALHVVQDGDHSLMAGKRRLKALGRTQEDVDGEILDAVRRFYVDRRILTVQRGRSGESSGPKKLPQTT